MRTRTLRAWKRVLPCVLYDDGRKFDVRGFHVKREAPVSGRCFSAGGRFLRGGVCETRDGLSDRVDTEALLEDFIETVPHSGRRGGCGDRIQLGRGVDR